MPSMSGTGSWRSMVFLLRRWWSSRWDFFFFFFWSDTSGMRWSFNWNQQFLFTKLVVVEQHFPTALALDIFHIPWSLVHSSTGNRRYVKDFKGPQPRPCTTKYSPQLPSVTPETFSTFILNNCCESSSDIQLMEAYVFTRIQVSGQTLQLTVTVAVWTSLNLGVLFLICYISCWKQRNSFARSENIFAKATWK